MYYENKETDEDVFLSAGGPARVERCIGCGGHANGRFVFREFVAHLNATLNSLPSEIAASATMKIFSDDDGRWPSLTLEYERPMTDEEARMLSAYEAEERESAERIERSLYERLRARFAP